MLKRLLCLGFVGASWLGGCGGGGAADAGAVDAGPSDAGVADTGPVDAGPPPVRLGLNDVSVLFPLPESLEAEGYLGPQDMGARGVLLPQEVFDQVPTFPVMPADGLLYGRLRVLAIRVDTCGGLPSDCHPELRMVMQPLNPNGLARDSALHLFYRLTPEAMTAVVAGLREAHRLGDDTAAMPLSVHPTLAAQGVTGAYGAALRRLVLQHVGAENLLRVTFFLRAPPVQEVWFFGGFERGKEGPFAPMTIVGVGRGNQRVILTQTEGGYSFDFTPVAAMPEDGRALLSSSAAAAASDEARRAAFGSFLRVENPRRYVPDQLPCAGCHVAAFVRSEVSRRHGLSAATFGDDPFRAERDLTMQGTAGENASSLRAFGYFRAEPMIAQRTINESAAVLEHLERTYPATR